MWYKGTLTEMTIIDAQISANCGWPDGNTQNWDAPRQTIDSGVYAIATPEGSHGFTKEQMTQGVNAIEYDNVEFEEVE